MTKLLQCEKFPRIIGMNAVPDTKKILEANETVKSALKARGLNMQDLATALDLSYITVTRASTCQTYVTKHTISVREKIADFVGLDAHVLWPPEVMDLAAKERELKDQETDNANLVSNVDRARSALEAVGMTFYTFANKKREPYTNVLSAMRGVGPRSDLREEVAQLAGMHPTEIWPDLYNHTQHTGHGFLQNAADRLTFAGMPGHGNLNELLDRLRTLKS